MRKKYATIASSVLIISMLITPFSNIKTKGASESISAADLKNPRVEEINSYKNEVTYDCVYFGSYPQAEIVPSEYEASTIHDGIKNGENDYIIDEEVYAKLLSATWTENETVINGEKYRRMKATDSKHATESRCFYFWGRNAEGSMDTETYHYFKYQPIKWRVLNIKNNQAFLLSDVVLDNKEYLEKKGSVNLSVTWETSTVRSFLNSYNSDKNKESIDYTKTGFYNRAFSSDEKQKIVTSKIQTNDNISDFAVVIPGGNDTEDKIFLLSTLEVSTEAALQYGFMADKYKYDYARMAKSTSYAKAMGINTSYKMTYDSYSDWWLRTPGTSTDKAMEVSSSGRANSCYNVNHSYVGGIRPALRLDMTTYNPIYAGIVCTDGTVVDPTKPEDSTTEDPTMSDGPHQYRNPKIKKNANGSVEVDQFATYDCVYYGTYPQQEVVSSKSQVNIYVGQSDQDYIIDQDLYSKLTNEEFWIENEAIIDGEKYRRITSLDANYVGEPDGLNNDFWERDEDGNVITTRYHYFKYQPIKWRVLQVENDKLFLLAEQELDCKKYHEEQSDITWENATIRSFLNSYGSSDNSLETDYSKKGFYNSAFSAAEKLNIINTDIANKDSVIGGKDGIATVGGNDTEDKVFLLSEADVFTDEAVKYGFVSKQIMKDYARIAQSSLYAKAMGCFMNSIQIVDSYKKTCSWWLRSPGYTSEYAVVVRDDGNVFGSVNMVDSAFVGVRPALYLDISTYTPDYAGTVCSDGTVVEVEKKPAEDISTTESSTEQQAGTTTETTQQESSTSSQVTTQTSNETATESTTQEQSTATESTTQSQSGTTTETTQPSGAPSTEQGSTTTQQSGNQSVNNTTQGLNKDDSSNNSNTSTQIGGNQSSSGNNKPYTTPSINPTIITPESSNQLRNGYEVTVSGLCYKVTSTYSKTVMFTGIKKTAQKSKKKIIIPKTIKINGTSYKVTEIKAGALAGNQYLQAVKICSNVKKIGAKAFCNCKKLKTVAIEAGQLKKVGSKAFYHISKKVKFSITETFSYSKKEKKALVKRYQKMIKKAAK